MNHVFTKFFFVTLGDDPSAGTRLRQAGATIARGFFNDFDADGARKSHTLETIHFFVTRKLRACP